MFCRDSNLFILIRVQRPNGSFGSVKSRRLSLKQKWIFNRKAHQPQALPRFHMALSSLRLPSMLALSTGAWWLQGL